MRNEPKAVVMYPTSDGKFHPTKEEARARQAEINLFDDVREALKGINPATIVPDLCNNLNFATRLRDVCTKVIQHHGKYRKAKIDKAA